MSWSRCSCSLFGHTEEEYIPDAESVYLHKQQHHQPQACTLAQCLQLYTKEEQVTIWLKTYTYKLWYVVRLKTWAPFCQNLDVKINFKFALQLVVCIELWDYVSLRPILLIIFVQSSKSLPVQSVNLTPNAMFQTNLRFWAESCVDLVVLSCLETAVLESGAKRAEKSGLTLCEAYFKNSVVETYSS